MTAAYLPLAAAYLGQSVDHDIKPRPDGDRQQQSALRQSGRFALGCNAGSSSCVSMCHIAVPIVRLPAGLTLGRRRTRFGLTTSWFWLLAAAARPSRSSFRSCTSRSRKQGLNSCRVGDSFSYTMSDWPSCRPRTACRFASRVRLPVTGGKTPGEYSTPHCPR
jgi:hypothetical protein